MLLALLAQVIVIFVSFGDADEVRRFVLPFSYVFLFVFVIANWRRIGLLIIGAGALLNLLVIAANGGLMPITPANLAEAGLEEKLAELEHGDSVPDTKNVLLEADDTRLQFLSDRFTWNSPGPVPVFSIGDAVIGAGLLVLALEFLLPAFRKALQGRPSFI